MRQASKPAVLVVGAGLSGHILALTLAKNGVPVRIIEKDAHFHVGQRGPGIQPRSLELFKFLDILPDVLKSSLPVYPRLVYEMPGGTKVVSEINMSGPPREPTPSIPYPDTVLIGQDHLEELIRAHLTKLNVEVELGVELVRFEQDEIGVKAHVLRRGPAGDETETLLADWIVSAEGGRSTIRKQLGLTFLGETRDDVRFIIADVYIQGIDSDHWHCWGKVTDTLVNMRPTEYPGLFNISISICDPEFDVEPLMNSRNAFIEYIYKSIDRRDLTFGEVVWQTKWKANIRMVNQFSSGRAFLIGDAAHVHTPAGGQGANTGMQDGFNLGWKLSMVHKGLSNPSLLTSYNDERLPVARAVLDRTTAYVQTKFSKQNTAPAIFRQLGVNYRWSSIVVDEQGARSTGEEMAAYLPEDNTELRAGDRAPDASDLRLSPKTDDEVTTLFSVFRPNHHTVLLFDPTTEEFQTVLDCFKAIPRGAFRVVVVLPSDRGPIESTYVGSDYVLMDVEGHALAAYHPIKAGFKVIVVRPDGVVGAIAKGNVGLAKYLKAVFSPSLSH